MRPKLSVRESLQPLLQEVESLNERIQKLRSSNVCRSCRSKIPFCDSMLSTFCVGLDVRSIENVPRAQRSPNEIQFSASRRRARSHRS